MCDDSLPVPCVVTVVQALGLPDVASGLLLKGVVQLVDLMLLPT